MITIGVDVGGTFTDIILFDSENKIITVHKTPSTPDSQDIAVIEGIKEILKQQDIKPENVDLVVHGTTVATNAMLERNGAKVCLVTTKGLEDVLEIGRQNRQDIYDITASRPTPLVKRNWRIGISERIDAEGNPIEVLTDEEIDKTISKIQHIDSDSIAISLLFSYKNADHENRLFEAISKRTGKYTVASSKVLPEFREYERSSTTVLEAYLGPLVLTYLQRLDKSIKQLCPNAKLTLMQSNGGTILCSETEGRTIGLAISGLAGGVIGGWEIARERELSKAITLDMGGTSCDISAVVEKIIVRPDNDVDGLPIRVPAVDVKTIGAGGGSIAWIDEVGVLHVGPQSAGAEPGPAAYGYGGQNATVTDANLILGRLNPDNFLGGTFPLDVAASRRAIEKLANSLSMSLEETALGIIKISTSNMVQAIREVTVERGHDPRKFILIPFGGAGPTQACEIAESLGINQILIPPHPGITSAYGLIVADFRVDTMKSIVLTGNQDSEKILQKTLDALQEETRKRLVQQGVPPETIVYEFSIDMRYAGQSHELSIEVQKKRIDLIKKSRIAFENLHKAEFGYTMPNRDVEWVTARVVGHAPQSDLHKIIKRQKQISEHVSERPVIMPDGQKHITKIYLRNNLGLDQIVHGPSIIEQLDTTITIPPDWQGIQKENDILLLRRVTK
ncbi:MAG: hydantoinase/oxoprolinase family protein [Candidatus Lokiarchaeota archaeon]|nr:hydantoinase/oxoprolinase family protein [Candidatus Lokiarchaeota archaeon]